MEHWSQTNLFFRHLLTDVTIQEFDRPLWASTREIFEIWAKFAKVSFAPDSVPPGSVASLTW
jgi:hypothetical protein